MRLTRYATALFAIALLFLALQALSAEAIYKTGVSIAVPGNPLASTDILWVDSGLGHLFVADRSNFALDVFDTRANTYIGGIPTGTDTANGVAVDATSSRHNVFWGGTKSSLNVADGISLAPLGSISTGGTGRADEFGIDPRDQLILVANDQDSPPFLTLVGYNLQGGGVQLGIKGTLRLPQARAGIEQTVWDPGQGLFFVAIPNFNGTPAVIGVSPIAPSNGALNLVKVMPLPTCTGATGLALGPNEELFVGCAPSPIVISGLTGAVLATTPAATSNPDEVWFNPGLNQFLTVSNNAGAQNLVTMDATSFAIIDNIAVGTNHNVAVDSFSNSAFVLLRAGNPKCVNGCIAVFTDPPGSGALPDPTLQNPAQPIGGTANTVPGNPPNGLPSTANTVPNNTQNIIGFGVPNTVTSGGSDTLPPSGASDAPGAPR